MRIGVLLLSLGVVCWWRACRLALGGSLLVGATAAALTWLGTSLVIVGLGHLGLGTRVFGKRPNGAMAPWSVLLLFPYLACGWAAWRLRRVASAATPYQELLPGIIIGRRLLPAEYPPGVDCVLDLTCEFPEFKAVRQGKRYCCFPILDTHGAESGALVRLLRELDCVEGTLYVHCAEGYGRTGMVAAAILLARGLARNADEAVEMVRAKRPGVRLTRRQRAAVADVARALAQRHRTS